MQQIMKPVLQFLSNEEIQIIHQSALQILSSIGMRLPHPEALDLMRQNGADIGDENVVRIPTRLVEAAIESVPKRKEVTLFGRDPKHDVILINRHQILKRKGTGRNRL